MEQSVLKDKVILIVDDYAINAELVSFSVSDAGAIPLIASNGKECIEIIKSQNVDMILMDHNMPVMDGIEATKVIRSLPQGKKVIIIGISCSDEGKEREVSLQAGMNDVIDKLTLNCGKLIEVTKPFFYDSNRRITSENDGNGMSLQSIKSEKNAALNFEVMKYEKTLKEFDNDRDLLMTLLQDFNTNIHSQLKKMREALYIKDYESIGRESHGIKGGAANLNAFLLAEAAKSLEKSCKKSEDFNLISDLVDELSCNIDLFDKFVKNKDF